MDQKITQVCEGRRAERRKSGGTQKSSPPFDMKIKKEITWYFKPAYTDSLPCRACHLLQQAAEPSHIIPGHICKLNSILPVLGRLKLIFLNRFNKDRLFRRQAQGWGQ